MKFLDDLLQVKTVDRTTFQIIIWWEKRRILYNFIALIAGFVSTILMISIASQRVNLTPGEDFYEPIMVVFFAFLCNIGYTLGWLTEIYITRNLTYGPKMFKRGLYFTLFLIFLPTTIWLVIVIFNLYKPLS